MSENKIAYTSRTYDDYKKSIRRIIAQYYPDVFERLDDAALGQWLVDILADMGDNLNYHIDRVYQETSINSASQLSSLQNIARSNGLHITGKKCALCEIELSCVVPPKGLKPDDTSSTRFIDTDYCPIVRKGSMFSSGTVTFELMNDLNFAEQFNSDGMSDRKIVPIRNSNGNIENYRVTKLAVVQASQSKIYKKVITSADIKPFMEFTIQDSNIVGIESIIFKKGTNFSSDPVTYEFTIDEETYTDKNGNQIQRYFEVDNLIDQYRFGEVIEKGDNNNYNPVWEELYVPLYHDVPKKDENGNEIKNENGESVYETDILKDSEGKPIYVPQNICVRGEWKRLKNKFVTEYDDNWNLKIIFGAGLRNQYGTIPENAKQFTQYMMSRMQANDYMGVLPEVGSTMYVLYHVGGGEISNIAANTLTNIIYNNYSIAGNCDDQEDNRKKNNVRNSFRVTNTTPSYGGKDEPSEEEIKYMIKYNTASQNRCVTLHDYKSKINQLPAKFGCPFRIGVIEENNKVVIYALGLNSEGKLTNILSETVADNIIEYLSHYKMLNDFIEMRSGKIINISFRVTLYADKSYDKAAVAKKVIDEIYDYMDIRKHEMGEDIFLGDLQKNISQIDGVINISQFQAYNKTGYGYSKDTITQELVTADNRCYYSNGDYVEDTDNMQIDLNASDMILYSEANSLFEIKDKAKDITVVVKTR